MVGRNPDKAPTNGEFVQRLGDRDPDLERLSGSLEEEGPSVFLGEGRYDSVEEAVEKTGLSPNQVRTLAPGYEPSVEESDESYEGTLTRNNLLTRH